MSTSTTRSENRGPLSEEIVSELNGHKRSGRLSATEVGRLRRGSTAVVRLGGRRVMALRTRPGAWFLESLSHEVTDEELKGLDVGGVFAA